MKKARIIFLCIGFIIFAISFAVFAIDEVESAINSIAVAQNDDIFGASGEWFWISLNVSLIPLPFLLSELSLIKNGYVLLTSGQPKARKTLCIISSILSLLIIVMILLVKNRCFEYHICERILLALWPILIASFILGFIRIGIAKDSV